MSSFDFLEVMSLILTTQLLQQNTTTTNYCNYYQCLQITRSKNKVQLREREARRGNKFSFKHQLDLLLGFSNATSPVYLIKLHSFMSWLLLSDYVGWNYNNLLPYERACRKAHRPYLAFHRLYFSPNSFVHWSCGNWELLAEFPTFKKAIIMVMSSTMPYSRVHLSTDSLTR